MLYYLVMCFACRHAISIIHFDIYYATFILSWMVSAALDHQVSKTPHEAGQPDLLSQHNYACRHGLCAMTSIRELVVFHSSGC